jgi:hypothetical protein
VVLCHDRSRQPPLRQDQDETGSSLFKNGAVASEIVGQLICDRVVKASIGKSVALTGCEFTPACSRQPGWSWDSMTMVERIEVNLSRCLRFHVRCLGRSPILNSPSV